MELRTAKQIREYEDMVKRPGKFEGEARYIPYFWEYYLDGLADEDDGEILTFHINEHDIAVFPELKDTVQVQLYEREDGFVCEV